jgi:predicted RNA-binding Zn ribbon-like protein
VGRRSPIARWRRRAPPVADVDLHGASRAQVVLGAFAIDAIDLLTGPDRRDLRACGAPGCVLLFLKDHPRREWCSAACGNRARQARHYARTEAEFRGASESAPHQPDLSHTSGLVAL